MDGQMTCNWPINMHIQKYPIIYICSNKFFFFFLFKREARKERQKQAEQKIEKESEEKQEKEKEEMLEELEIPGEEPKPPAKVDMAMVKSEMMERLTESFRPPGEPKLKIELTNNGHVDQNPGCPK